MPRLGRLWFKRLFIPTSNDSIVSVDNASDIILTDQYLLF